MSPPARRLIHVSLSALVMLAAGCGPLPAARPGVLAVNEPAAAAGGVLLGLALRQETAGDLYGRRPFCHVDMVVGGRIVGFYNTHRRARWSDRLSAAWLGAFRERDWLAENRPYYVDAAAARQAVVKGKRRPIVTTWIHTRIPPEEARRIESALNARAGAAATARYRLAENNCATRLAQILIDADWLPSHPGLGGLPGLDRPVLLARLFARRAGTVHMTRGWFTFTPEGGVLIEPLPE